jgi:hypothetical protein
MYLKILWIATLLAAPAVALEDVPPEFSISLRI